MEAKRNEATAEPPPYEEAYPPVYPPPETSGNQPQTPSEEAYPPVYPPPELTGDQSQTHVNGHIEETTIAAASSSAPTGKAKQVEEAPPGYFDSTGWGDESDFTTGFEASKNVRAVMFENQRWYFGGAEWSEPLPTDRSTFSNGDGSRSCEARPKFTENKMWCIDRSHYPENCDEEGWTYAFNFTTFDSKSSWGRPKPSTTSMVRRRKWMAPIPLSLLQNVRNSGANPAKGEIVVENDDIVFDILDTEEVAPSSSASRTITTHLLPSSATRKSFLEYEGAKVWCDLTDKKLHVYLDRKDLQPCFVVDLRGAVSVQRGRGEPNKNVLLITLERGQQYKFHALTDTEGDGWFVDLDNIVESQKNWETAGQVAAVVGTIALALAAGAAGGRRGR